MNKDVIEEWSSKAIELINKATDEWGIKASLTHTDNYGAVFTRDAVMSGICGLLVGDKRIIVGFEATIKNLKSLQGEQGQICSNYMSDGNSITKVSYGTLSPKYDALCWYLIGVGLLLKNRLAHKEDYLESVTKGLSLLDGMEYNGKHLFYMPRGGDWADEYIYEGYVLHDQLLRLWALKLLGELYGNATWYRKGTAIEEVILEKYPSENKGYFYASFSPVGVFDKFDLSAHALALLFLDNGDEKIDSAIDWLFDTFVDKGKLPPAFYPSITETDKEWEDIKKFSLFRFKNKPNHFHNGGIWWIWLGWTSLALNYRKKYDQRDKLIELAVSYLEAHKDTFEFDEYISSDKLELSGAKQLTYTASGIIMMQLASQGADLSQITPYGVPTTRELIKLKSNYFTLANDIALNLLQRDSFGEDKYVIAVGGESGSGKSVTAYCLQHELSKLNIPSIIIHQDGYYKLTPKENHEARKADINHVGIEELYLERMQAHVDTFKQSSDAIDIPVVDYLANTITDDKALLCNKRVMIIEGVYTFFLQNVDFRIFMTRTYKDTFHKRMERTREEYDPFVEKVLDIEHNIIAPQHILADIKISKQYTIEKKPSNII